MAELLYQELTEKIIKAFLEVYNFLGYGHTKNIYLEAMNIEMSNLGLEFEKSVIKDIMYKDVKVGEDKLDFINENKVLLKIDNIETITESVEFALLNSLKASKLEVGLVLNFGRKPEVRRKIFQNGKYFVISNEGNKPYEQRDKKEFNKGFKKGFTR